MKYLALLAIFAIFAPVAVYGQTAMGQITIEPYPDSTDIAVEIEGELDDGGETHLIVRGDFGSNSPSAHMIEHTFADSYTIHVFNLDMPFQSGQKYTVSVYNGENVRVLIDWIPLPNEKQKAKNNANTVEKVAFDLTEKESEAMIQTLLNENKILKPQFENKDRIIFEQLKVIEILAPDVSNAVFEESNSKLHFIADTSENSDYLQSLAQENKLLKAEIEKQQAIIMEQVYVIQNLASEWTNTSSESNLNHYSLV